MSDEEKNESAEQEPSEDLELPDEVADEVTGGQAATVKYASNKLKYGD
jgi:hypothetical protein